MNNPTFVKTRLPTHFCKRSRPYPTIVWAITVLTNSTLLFLIK